MTPEEQKETIARIGMRTDARRTALHLVSSTIAPVPVSTASNGRLNDKLRRFVLQCPTEMVQQVEHLIDRLLGMFPRKAGAA